MPPKLWKYYLLTNLVPATVSLLGILLFLSVESQISALSVLKNVIAGQGLDSTVLRIASIHTVILAAFTTTLFFNLFTKVRRTPLYSLLSWFFLPLIYLVSMVLASDESDYETVVVIVCATLPYVLGLTISFILFRRKVKTAESNLVTPIAPLID